MSTGREKLRAFRAHLDRSLFLQAPPPQQTLKRWEYIALVVGLLLLAVVLQLARAGLSTSLNSLWAEDGAIFLKNGLTQGVGDSIFTVYSNYLVLVPSAIGELAAQVPLKQAAAMVSILSATLVALSGLVIWHASAPHIRNPYLRGTLALLTVLTPVGALESVDSASYVSWYMLFATFWILLWRPRTRQGPTLAGLFVLATALSNPGVWFFLPLAALRALAVRDRRDTAILAGFAIGAAIQVPILALGSEPAVEPLWTSDIWTVYLQRVVDGAAFGLGLGGSAWTLLGWPLLIVLCICGVIGLVLGLRRSNTAARYIAAVAVPTSVVMFVASLYQRAVAPQMVWPANDFFGAAGRYAIVPALLLISVAFVLIDGFLRRSERGNLRRPPWPVLAAVSLMLVAIASSFWVADPTARGTPPWDKALEDAATACTTEHLPAATIQTSPPGFVMQIPCEQVASFSQETVEP